VGLAALLSLALLVTACSVDVPTVATPDVPVGTSRLENLQDDTSAGAPEDEGFDSRTLMALTEWIRDHRVPIFSFLISRNGTLVYELYTSSLTRAQARWGIDLGGYGLRLRPIDMQKFGVLYLNRGMWRGHPLISREWVERSFVPWNHSRPNARDPDYGWFWWAYTTPAGWSTHAAVGWKGQRIAVLPGERLVVTMTAAFEDGAENRIFNELMDQFVLPAIR
jgi:CubicO group peptidase (beta-lactamase class C family)